MGTRFWNCVGRCSQIHSDDEYGTDFPQEQFTVGYVFQQCRSSSSLIAMVLFIPKLCGVHRQQHSSSCSLVAVVCSSRNFGANPTASAGNGTSADDDRMQVGSLKKGKGKSKGKHQNLKGNRTTSARPTRALHTDINTCKNSGRTGHCAKDCWRPGGGAHDNSISDYSNTQTGKSHKKGKGKSKHVDVVETNQPSETASTVSCPSQTPSTIGEPSCHSNVEPWIMGVTINSVSTRKTSWCKGFAS